jgi:hypothetical protein
MSRQGWCEERGARGFASAQAGCNVGSGISFASFRRFWAVAARRNSSRAPDGIPVFDKSGRADGTFSREDFAYDQQSDVYICPAGKVLASTGTLVNDGTTLLYRMAPTANG